MKTMVSINSHVVRRLLIDRCKAAETKNSVVAERIGIALRTLQSMLNPKPEQRFEWANVNAGNLVGRHDRLVASGPNRCCRCQRPVPWQRTSWATLALSVSNLVRL